MNTFAETWDTDLSALYRSPLGYTFPYPESWKVHTVRSTVEVIPDGLPFVPLRVLSAQVNEQDLSTLEKRLLRQIQNNSANRVLETRRLAQPRSALLIEVATTFQDLDLQQYYVAELLNRGQLTLVFTITAIAGATTAEDLLVVWRDAEVPPIQTASGFRKMALESLKVAFEFPSDWVIQHASDSLVEMRSPVRSSNEPNVVMEVEAGTTEITLSDLTQQTLAFIRQEKLGAQNVQHSEAVLGNCPATEIHYEILNENQQLDHVWVLVPDPQIVSAAVTVRLAGLAQRWDEYLSLFKQMQSSFLWLR